jgi:hypothetical protein
MLTKTVLYALPGGACKLVEVAFNWQHGDPLPPDALERYFPNVTDALSELAARGRLAQRVHVEKPAMPEKPPTTEPPPGAASAIDANNSNPA